MKLKMRKNTIKANITSEKIETKDKQKAPSNKTKNNSIQRFNSIQIHTKIDEKGTPTEKGVRFTDKQIIGSHSNAKITGVKVWTEKSTF